MAIRDYKELLVWQKSMELVFETYRVVKLLPKDETYALSDQIRRSAVSIPSNIAEGYNRGTDKELIRYLYIAKGSRAELETQVLIAQGLGYINPEDAEKLNEISCEIGKMLNAFISKISR